MSVVAILLQEKVVRRHGTGKHGQTCVAGSLEFGGKDFQIPSIFSSKNIAMSSGETGRREVEVEKK